MMGRDYQGRTIELLSEWFARGWLSKAQKKNPGFAHKIQSLTPSDITFGNNPKFFTACIEGNCTASGESTYGDTTTRRTISTDFNTGSMLFLSPDSTADGATCQAALKYLPELGDYSEYHRCGDTENIAEKHGKQLARQSLSDLDFSMKEYRLNRYQRHPLSDTYDAPIWPIYGQIMKENGKPQKVHIGFWYRRRGEDYVDFDISIPLTKKKKQIIAGIVGAAILLLLLISFFL